MSKTLLKPFMLLVALVATTAFAACGDDDDNGGGTTVSSLKVTQSSLTFARDGGELTFSAQSAVQATAVSDQAWCNVTAGTMSANLKVTPVTVSVVAMTTELNDRTATITVKAGSETATVSVTQKAGDILIVEQTAYSVPAEGGTVSVQLTANAAVSVSISAEWLKQTGGDGGGYVFTAEANTGATRTATITFTLASKTATVSVTQEAAAAQPITATAMEVARLMVPGWNLGNTMEAPGSSLSVETSWQGTKTTQQVIDYVKSLGFRSVRIPCSWNCHSTNGKIDAQWTARVKEIVDYCVNDGLYVVLNDHWDNGWIEVLGFSKSSSSYQPVDEATITAKATRLKELWTQIANAFRDYDEHLLFAGLNEPFQEYNLFSSRHEELTPILIRYNQAFVEAVRATGGNNAQRTLVVQGPSTNISSTCSYMPADKLPEAAGRLMVEVHYYDPGQFCGTYEASGDNAYYYWGAANHGANHNPTYGEESYLDGMFTNLKDTFTSKGYPVIIGEYAALQRSVPNDDQTKHDNSVKYYYQYLNQTAANCGIVPFAWDTNDTAGLGKESGSTTIIDRAKCTVVGTNAMEGIKAGAAAGSWPF